MFELTNEDNIIDLINAKRKDNIVIPLYVSVYNAPYSLLELDEIQNCTPSAFKVGYGASSKQFYDMKFPVSRLMEFQNVTTFSRFDEDQQLDVKYFVFESTGIDDDGSQLANEINSYFSMLMEHVMKHVEEVRRERIKREMEEVQEEMTESDSF